jgi:hypothetical protein
VLSVLSVVNGSPVVFAKRETFTTESTETTEALRAAETSITCHPATKSSSIAATVSIRLDAVKGTSVYCLPHRSNN